jgi:hypothetical protein
MMHKSFATPLKAGVVAFLLVVFLFADGVWGSSVTQFGGLTVSSL